MPWSVVASAVVGSVASNVVGSVFGSGGGGSSGGGSSQPNTGGSQNGLAGQVVGGIVANSLAPSTARAGAEAADPFGSQRGQYQTQLSNLMNGGFAPNDPSYKWRMDQGLEAVNRGTAASGGLNSGGRLTALEQYGQGMASQEYQSQFSRLAGLAGANSGSPGTAGQIIASQGAANQKSASAFGNAVGGAVNGIGKSLVDAWGKPIPGQAADGGNGNGGFSSDGTSYNNPSAYSGGGGGTGGGDSYGYGSDPNYGNNSDYSFFGQF